MDATDPRAALDALIRDSGEDYASLSRMLGRNPAYVQQFIKRGSPRRLSEEDRGLLARYFRVSEAMLGGPAAKPARASSAAGGGLVRVPLVAVDASAGPGALAGEERTIGALGFDPLWLKQRGLDPAALSVISVAGDSMMPTLGDGDDILVDRNDAAARLRDGIYVLRIDDALWVKRIAMSPAGRRFTIKSDNAAYPDWPDCDPADIALIGRVVWFGRRIV